MLTRLEKAQQKWGGSHSVIDNGSQNVKSCLCCSAVLQAFHRTKRKIMPFLISCKFKTFAKF